MSTSAFMAGTSEVRARRMTSRSDTDEPSGEESSDTDGPSGEESSDTDGPSGEESSDTDDPPAGESAGAEKPPGEESSDTDEPSGEESSDTDGPSGEESSDTDGPSGEESSDTAFTRARVSAVIFEAGNRIFCCGVGPTPYRSGGSARPCGEHRECAHRLASGVGSCVPRRVVRRRRP